MGVDTWVCVGVQGDREKEIGLTVSPLMDRRHKGGITRSQVRLCVVLKRRRCCMHSHPLPAMQQRLLLLHSSICSCYVTANVAAM